MYQGKNEVENRTVTCENTGKIMTATFFIEADFKNKTIPFDLEIHGEVEFEPTVSFLRLIKI